MPQLVGRQELLVDQGLVAHAERLKDFALNILAMNTDRARPKLGSIQHNVVRQRANFAQRRLGVVHGINIGLELRHFFFVERCEGMVRRSPALLDIVPLEHREIGDPEKSKIFRRVACLLKRFVAHRIFLGQIEPQESAFLAEMLHALLHDGGILGAACGSGQKP